MFEAAVSSTDRSFQLATPAVSSGCAAADEDEVEILRELQTILGGAPPRTASNDSSSLLSNGAVIIAPRWGGNDDINLGRYRADRKISGAGKYRILLKFGMCL